MMMRCVADKTKPMIQIYGVSSPKIRDIEQVTELTGIIVTIT